MRVLHTVAQQQSPRAFRDRGPTAPEKICGIIFEQNKVKTWFHCLTLFVEEIRLKMHCSPQWKVKGR